MSNKLHNILHEQTEHIELGTEEKALMRERLVTYMEHKPIRRHIAVHHTWERVPLVLRFFRSHHLAGALAIALIATSSTFGVSFAAEDALPGDLLYPMKVRVNEQVKSAFLDDTERITWERERAELRLKEATQLASEGRLSDSQKDEVSRLFAEHTEAMTERVHEVEARDPVLAAEVSNEFEAALDTHEAVLARVLVENEENVDESGRELVEQVRAAAHEAGKLRAGAEERLMGTDMAQASTSNSTSSDEGTSTAAAYEDAEGMDTETPKIESANMRERAAYRAQERAGEKRAAAEELLASLVGQMELRHEAEAQVRAADALMDEGEAALAAHDLNGAYVAYRSAGASLQKVVQLLEVATLFNIEILPDEEESADAGTTEGGTASEALTPENVQLLHEVVEERIRTAQTKLLTLQGYAAKTTEQASKLLKDAIAHMLRGEIALVLGEHADAETLFRSAERQVERAHALVEAAASRDELTEVPATDVHGTSTPAGTPATTTPAQNQASTTQASTSPVMLEQSYADGVHIISGELEGLGCMTLEAAATVAESYPEQITIAVTTGTPATSCVDAAVHMHPFSATATASPEAVLQGLTVDGVARTFSWRE